jgi:hypothetical protein
MIVSNFELLLKRIAPPLPGPAGAVARRLGQGYFLAITNLEPTRTINLRLRLVISASAPLSTFDREIQVSGGPINTTAIFDNANADNVALTLTSVTPAKADTREFITGRFTIRPNQTASVAILPDVAALLGTSNFEVRGFVVLEQVPVGIAQLLNGVPSAVVLTTPDQRGTALDNAFPTGDPNDELDFDQIAYTLPTASGRIQNTVEAVRGLIFVPDFPIGEVALARTAELESPDEIALEKALVKALRENKEITA